MSNVCARHHYVSYDPQLINLLFFPDNMPICARRVNMWSWTFRCSLTNVL